MALCARAVSRCGALSVRGAARCAAAAAVQAPLQARAYHQNVIDHYENPRNVGK